MVQQQVPTANSTGKKRKKPQPSTTRRGTNWTPKARLFLCMAREVLTAYHRLDS